MSNGILGAAVTLSLLLWAAHEAESHDLCAGGLFRNSTEIYKVDFCLGFWQLLKEEKMIYVEHPSRKITGYIVWDLSSEKNGQISVLNGGVGWHSVTFWMRRPAYGKWMHFNVHIYAEKTNEPLKVVVT